jgi:hypothetical protein
MLGFGIRLQASYVTSGEFKQRVLALVEEALLARALPLFLGTNSVN